MQKVQKLREGELINKLEERMHVLSQDKNR